MHFGPQMVFVQVKTWKKICIRSLHELVKGANQSSFQRLISNQCFVIPAGCLYEEIKGFIEQKFLLFYRPILPKLYLVSLGIFESGDFITRLLAYFYTCS